VDAMCSDIGVLDGWWWMETSCWSAHGPELGLGAAFAGSWDWVRLDFLRERVDILDILLALKR